MKAIKIGLLPLYLALYDERGGAYRERHDKFCAAIAGAFEKRGINVMLAPICRLAPEFRDAASKFEKAGVDAIVTIHLAYSPSLECADALAAVKPPIIVLDTTPTYSFAPDQDPGELMYNHGIHGVQDMCNLLLRKGKSFVVEAGHWKKSDVLDRVCSWARSAALASSMRAARVGRIGPAFQGMGDFDVPADVLKKTIGAETLSIPVARLKSMLPAANSKEIDKEIAADSSVFATKGLDKTVHRNSVRMGLAVRKLIEKEKLTAFSANFQNFSSAGGMPTLPFLEASKAMARGIGYAGEGDVLTSALVGALLSVYPETSFTEMFCPNWKDGTIFLSHMGEINYRVVAGKPDLIEKDMPFGDVDNPAIACGCFKPGKVCIVNLAPGPDNTYTLVIAPGAMVGVKKKHDNMRTLVRGWFIPSLPINDFLGEYSRYGGTHHSALVYGVGENELEGFGSMMGWKTVTL